jgi:hypothetical protein
MEIQSSGTTFGKRFAQIAWVVKDIHVAEKFFKEVIGVPNFVKMENLSATDLKGTYSIFIWSPLVIRSSN